MEGTESRVKILKKGDKVFGLAKGFISHPFNWGIAPKNDYEEWFRPIR